MAVMMVLSLVTVPVMAETPAANDPRLSTAPKTGTAAAPADAANLNEALNVAGGTLTFTSEGDHPWIVDGDAAKSTNVNVANSTSTVSTTVTAAAGDILQFDFMSFGEAAGDYVWDGLHLTVDGTEVMKWSRVETWTTYAVELTAGEHTVAWSYQKDGSVDREGDYATVDNVYVGAPVTPNAINVEAVSVPAGRRATVAYTVLPDPDQAEIIIKAIGDINYKIPYTATFNENKDNILLQLQPEPLEIKFDPSTQLTANEKELTEITVIVTVQADEKGDFAYNGKTLKFAIKATKVEVGNTTLDKFPITTFNFDMSKK